MKMDLTTLSMVLFFSIVWTLCYVLWPKFYSLKPSSSIELPPGPYPLPIIGNALQLLGQHPHKAFAKMSKTYGPIMFFKLGSKKLVVVSSPDIAKQTLVNHDQTLSLRRPIPVAAQAHDHDKISVAFLPAETQWRKLRRICREHIFSAQRLEASRGLRREKLCQLRDYVHKCCIKGNKVVDIQEAAYITALNLMWSTLFSADAAQYGSCHGQELKKIVQEVITSLSAPNIADYFSVLEAIDPQGIKRRADICVGKLLGMFEEIINERLKSREDASAFSTKDYTRKSDMLETLLDLSERDEYDLSHDEIKHLLLDLFLGGTDTTSNTVDWAMTELLLNPDKMSKLKKELYLVCGNSRTIEEPDIPKLLYLQAVIKEVFRYHPPAPFLIPHKAESDIIVNGYLVPKNTQVIINAWAIGRDSSIWSNPDSFEPERFLGSKIEVKGQDFELIPFGSGRRICPGMSLAHYMIHLMVAALVHNFDWRAEKLNTDENFGLSLRRLVPLTAVPVKVCIA